MTRAPTQTMDEMEPHGFHYRVAVFTAGGMFIDGYILGVLTIALPLLPSGFDMTSFWTGLIGAAALIGLFVGSLVGGTLTDRFGRKKLYLLDLTAFVILSALQFVVTDEMQLFVVRLLIGVAIGVDYAVGPAYLTEFMPAKQRGPLVGAMATFWRVGYLAAVGVGALLAGLDLGDDAWRWILVSATAPSLVVLLLRLGVPESPRWLVRQGRHDEAQAVVRKFLGENITIGDLDDEVGPRSDRPLRELLTPRWRGRLFFVGFFWLCQVAPGAALTTFLPLVFAALGVGSENLATVINQVFVVAGGVLGLLVINRIGRRPMLIGTFWGCAVALLALAWLPDGAAAAVVAIVATYAIFDALGGNLQYLYPSEVFPTGLRASAAGAASAMSRVGSIIATFGFPFVLDAYGVDVVLYLCAAITVAGALVSTVLAPETSGMTLAQASGSHDDVRRRPARP